MARKVGRPKLPPTPRELLTEVLPIHKMFSPEEILIYNSLIDIYLKDFDESDLTASDIDDLNTLATNKIIEIRLLSSSVDATSHLDYSTSLEKLRKQNEKLKDNLASRRKDRIDPNEFKGFSIVDIAIAFDNNKKRAMENKSKRLREKQKELQEQLTMYGNKDDVDGA